MSILLHLRTSWALKEQPLKKKKKQQQKKQKPAAVYSHIVYLS